MDIYIHIFCILVFCLLIGNSMPCFRSELKLKPSSVMKEAIIVLSLIFLAFSKQFLVKVGDKKSKDKTTKNTVANTEYGTDYGGDEDYEDNTGGKNKNFKVYFQFSNSPDSKPFCLLRTAVRGQARWRSAPGRARGAV